MKNTLAIAIILLGGMLVYGGYKDYSFADTIRFFTGQKLQNATKPTSGLSEKPFQDIPPKASKSSGGFAPSTTNPPSTGQK
jgi:hypothetical protein